MTCAKCGMSTSRGRRVCRSCSQEDRLGVPSDYIDDEGDEDDCEAQTDGGVDLSAFGVDVPDRERDPESDTSDDYRYTRPQCRALTASRERCSNPTVRGGDTDFCPAHDEKDVETIDDNLATDGGITTWMPGGDPRRRCQNCDTRVTRQFARVFGDNRDVVHACLECSTYREMHTKAPNVDSGDTRGEDDE